LQINFFLLGHHTTASRNSRDLPRALRLHQDVKPRTDRALPDPCAGNLCISIKTLLMQQQKIKTGPNSKYIVLVAAIRFAIPSSNSYRQRCKAQISFPFLSSHATPSRNTGLPRALLYNPKENERESGTWREALRRTHHDIELCDARDSTTTLSPRYRSVKYVLKTTYCLYSFRDACSD
ncbi:hypothetical protein CEXT_330041, partial [Caerostris extrusa]